MPDLNTNIFEINLLRNILYINQKALIHVLRENIIFKTCIAMLCFNFFQYMMWQNLVAKKNLM